MYSGTSRGNGATMTSNGFPSGRLNLAKENRGTNDEHCEAYESL